MLINTEPTMLISLRQSLGELMETRKYSQCTTSSFLLLLLQGQEDWRRIEGLPSLDWGLLSLCVSPPAFPEFVQLGLGSLQSSEDVTLEGFCAQWKVHCVWHHLRTVALDPALRLCALSGTCWVCSIHPAMSKQTHSPLAWRQ